MTKLVVLNAIGYINVEKKEKVYVKKEHVNIMKRQIQKHLGIRKQKNFLMTLTTLRNGL